MKQIIQQYKPIIDKRVTDLCNLTIARNVPWAEDVGKRMAEFVLRGKTIRGSLLLYTVDLFNHKHNSIAIDVAASLEFLHAALLIHDDLVDHDTLRRGQPSIHTQYKQLGEKQQVTNPIEFGEGMAICVGDIAIFGAFSYLAALPISQNIHQRLMQIVTSEYLTVGFGEIHDIALGYLPTIPSTQEVLNMYTKKTARYTFSLPFMVGAILTKQSEETYHTLEKLGEYLGLIYQLRDDVLTISGDEAEVGKTIGNDIVENKKTYASLLLWERVEEKEKNILKKIFGNPTATLQDIAVVQQAFKTHSVISDIEKYIQEIAGKAEVLIMKLAIPENKKTEIIQMMTYLQTRIK